MVNCFVPDASYIYRKRIKVLVAVTTPARLFGDQATTFNFFPQESDQFFYTVKKHMAYNGRPCAACKHQRIKCSPQCIFAPYFPPEQKQNFLNVKEVYGVNNVKEILSALDPKDRAAAVTSLCYEAEIRLKEPVYGCVGYVAHLQQRLKSLTTELASAYEELASLSGPSTGTMPRQHPAAAYGQMVYDPFQQQRKMMGVQLSSPAAVPYGAATAASHQSQMMGVGNNPSGQQQQHGIGIGMDMRQYAAVVATDQHQLGVQLSSSAAQMDAPAVHGRAGTQIMMGVGLGNPSSSTSGQQQQYGIDVDAGQYADLVATHQHQPQPGVDQLSSLAAQMGAPTVYGAGTQIMMGVCNNPSSSTSSQQQRYATLVASHQQQLPGVQLASPSAIPYGMTQAQMIMGTSDVYGGAGTSQQVEMMGVQGNDPSSGLIPFTNLAPSSQSQLIGEQYGSGYVTTDQVQRHDELGRNYSYQLHNQQQGCLASSSVLLPYTNRTGVTTSDVYGGGAGTSQQPQLTDEQQLYNQHEFGVLDYTQQYAAVAATDQQYEYISSDSGGENRRR